MNFETGPQWCLSLVPAFVHRDLVASLVCGLPLPAGSSKQIFLDTGLIHVMVVSGAHLMFLESLLGRVPSGPRLTILGGYCWLTGFGAPVVKAFFHRLCELQLKPRGWSPLQTEAAAIGLTLVCFPWWLFSRSLQMSWMCFLALTLPPVIRWRALDQSLKAYVLLFAFVGASPLGIGWNALLAPIVGVVLFPLSLALLALPFLTGPVTLVWDLFLWLLEWGPKAEPAPWFLSARDLFWLPLLLHAFLLVQEVAWRRAQAFSS